MEHRFRLFILPVLLAIAVSVAALLNSCNKDISDEYGPVQGTLTDIDGNVYETVLIGDMLWMAENLKTTRYNDGSPIQYPGSDNNAWISATRGAYSWYANDHEAYKDNYGALYNWHAVNTGKLCPAGWNVPGDEDWTRLNKSLAANAGGKLKRVSPLWQELTQGTTNETGFNALPGGVRFASLPGGSGVNSGGYFFYAGQAGRWWTSSEHSSSNAWYRSLHSTSSNMYMSYGSKGNGFSVRCVRGKK